MQIVGLDGAAGLPHELVGKKGLGLATLWQAGLPVSPGFILTTDTLYRWQEGARAPDETLRDAVRERLDLLRREVDASVSSDRPFLVSVRSSPTISMPGLLSTILNVGIRPGWVVDQLQSERTRSFGWELAKTFLLTYVEASGDDAEILERIRLADEEFRTRTRSVPSSVLALLRDSPAKEALLEQVLLCIESVFRSQFKERSASALAQRALGAETPMAIIVQAMVFGNRSEKSASGVLWTRDMQTGTRPPAGTYLPMAQGPQVVGSLSPLAALSLVQMRADWPTVYEELRRISDIVDRTFAQVQELEFTVEDERVWLLQARDAALSPLASIRYACDRVDSGEWSAAEAVRTTRPDALPRLAETATSDRLLASTALVARGLSASAGVATGPLTPIPTLADGELRDALSSLPDGAIVIAESLTPYDDFGLMRRGGGFVSVRGGPGTHTASLLRKLGKPYIVNVDCEVVISQRGDFVALGGTRVDRNELVTIFGDRGHLFRGELRQPRDVVASQQIERFEAWMASYGSRSNWRVFNYDSPGSREIRNAVATVLSAHRWKSEKAVTTELMRLIPETWRIDQRVFAAEAGAAIRSAMIAGLAAGFWMGAKVCRTTDPRLGNGPWQTGINTVEEVDAFLTDPDYEGVSGLGGYLRWTTDPAVSELVLVFDPPEKGERDAEAQHFVCTVSCSASPPQVQLALMLGTSKLRSLESASPSQLIVVIIEPDYQHPEYLGFVRPIVGRAYWSTSHEAERDRSAMLRRQWSFQGLESLVDARSLAVAKEVTRLVLYTLWQPPFDLPHYLMTVDDEFGLDTLEFQGRADANGRISFFKVFDAKGHDEQLFADSVGISGD